MSHDAEAMVETGVVLRVVAATPGRGAGVVVRVEPGDHCEGCGARALCHAASDDRREIEAEDPLGCQAGDEVRVSVAGCEILRMSLLLYGLPLLLLLGGVLLGGVVIPAGRWRDPGSFLLATTLAALALPLAHALARRHEGAGAALRAKVVERTVVGLVDQVPDRRPTSTP